MHLINNEIKNKRIKIVGENGSTENEVSLDTALNIAYESGLDLVEMNSKDGLSICKLMNYSKYLYEQKKSKKKVKKSALKDIKFGCNIADHDLKISAKKAMNILNEGDKVRVLVVFRGRQAMFADSQGKPILDRFLTFFEEDSVVVTKPPKLEGTMYSMCIEKKKK